MHNFPRIIFFLKLRVAAVFKKTGEHSASAVWSQHPACASRILGAWEPQSLLLSSRLILFFCFRGQAIIDIIKFLYHNWIWRGKFLSESGKLLTNMSGLHFLLRYIMGILIYLYSFWCYHIPTILGQGPGTKTYFFKVKDKNYRPSEMLSWCGSVGEPLSIVKETDEIYRKQSLKIFGLGFLFFVFLFF